MNLALPSVDFKFGGVDPGPVHPNSKGAGACAILSILVAACGL